MRFTVTSESAPSLYHIFSNCRSTIVQSKKCSGIFLYPRLDIITLTLAGVLDIYPNLHTFASESD